MRPVFMAIVFGLTMAIAGLTGAQAFTALPKPEGRVILSLGGQIERTNAGTRAEFDRKMLEEIGLVELETETPYTDGKKVFRGVLARDLLRHVGATGDHVEATAINLYKVDIPIEDFERFDVLIALEVDGKRLRVRDQGPAWVIYPWSQHQHLDSKTYNQRSIWQLASIDIR